MSKYTFQNNKITPSSRSNHLFSLFDWQFSPAFSYSFWIFFLFVGLPTPSPPCIDKIPNCNQYSKESCTSPSYRPWAEDNCRAHCKFCTPAAGQGILPIFFLKFKIYCQKYNNLKEILCTRSAYSYFQRAIFSLDCKQNVCYLINDHSNKMAYVYFIDLANICHLENLNE